MSASSRDAANCALFEFTLNGKSMILISEVYSSGKIAIYDSDDISAPVSTGNISSAGFHMVNTQKMTDQMKNDGYEPAAKLNTVTVSEVIIPDEYVSMDIDSVRIYAMGKNDYKDSFFGIINGAMNYGELTSLTGEKPKTLLGRMLAIGFLQGSQPFGMFLAKTILALLTGGVGGCSLTGAGIVLCLCAMAIII